jgi:hypothetical protein
MRHLYKLLPILALLLLILGVYRQAHQIDADSDTVRAAEFPTDVMNRRGKIGPHLQPQRVEAANSAIPESAWAGALDSVLRDMSHPGEKSQRLLELLPHLPVALQPEAAQHLVNLATDEKPCILVDPLQDLNIAPAAHAVLLLGLLQRADHVRLPALLDLARNAEHPKSAQALEYLCFVLESDHGTDWRKWEQSIAARLKLPPFNSTTAQ